jgi:hypothetical protein
MRLLTLPPDFEHAALLALVLPPGTGASSSSPLPLPFWKSMLRTSPAIARGIALRSAASPPDANSKGLETGDFAFPALPVGGSRQSVERQAIQSLDNQSGYHVIARHAAVIGGRGDLPFRQYLPWQETMR